MYPQLYGGMDPSMLPYLAIICACKTLLDFELKSVVLGEKFHPWKKIKMSVVFRRDAQISHKTSKLKISVSHSHLNHNQFSDKKSTITHHTLNWQSMF